MYETIRINTYDPDYRRIAKATHVCEICGKAIKTPKYKMYVLDTTFADAFSAIHRDDIHLVATEHMFLNYVGTDCAKRLGMEWVTV